MLLWPLSSASRLTEWPASSAGVLEGLAPTSNCSNPRVTFIIFQLNSGPNLLARVFDMAPNKYKGGRMFILYGSRRQTGEILLSSINVHHMMSERTDAE